jgi:trigger factor
MNISKEQIDALNAVVTIKVEPQDYNEKFEKAVKKVQQQMAMPGFRPGKVPTGLIKKRYGKSILLEELNKVLSESLNQYIVDNKLDILGNPLPKPANESIDLDNQKEFSFSFELGLSPELNIVTDKSVHVPYQQIQVDNELIEKYVADVRRNYGKPGNPDVAEEKDVLYLDIVELDEKNEIVPGGIFKSTSIGIERLKNESTRKKLLGVKKEDKIILNVHELYETAVEIGVGLGIEKEKAENLNCNVQLTIKNIARIEHAELNTELFDKIYGAEVVKTEEEFRAKIKEELQVMFAVDADKRFLKDAREKLVEIHQPKLPDDFLKRWLLTANDKPVTAEQIEQDYEAWSNLMKWKLIENNIAKNHQISISEEDMRNETRAFILDQYRRFGHVPDEKELEKVMNNVLSNESEARKIADNIMDKKILLFLKENVTLDAKEVSYNEFFGVNK